MASLLARPIRAARSTCSSTSAASTTPTATRGFEVVFTSARWPKTPPPLEGPRRRRGPELARSTRHVRLEGARTGSSARPTTCSASFRGHPDLRRILMYPEFEGHPLRKDYPARRRSRSSSTATEKFGVRPRRSAARPTPFRPRRGHELQGRRSSRPAGEAPKKELMEPIDLDLEEGELELPAEPMRLNMGPSHPAMHGTVRIVLELDGETIDKVDVQIGYLHRGFEKMCERGTWAQVFPYVDRLNYVSPMLNNVGYALAVEKLLGMTGARALPVVPRDRSASSRASATTSRATAPWPWSSGRSRRSCGSSRPRDDLGHPRGGDRRAPDAQLRPRRRHGRSRRPPKLQGRWSARCPRVLGILAEARRCCSRTASSSTASRASGDLARRTRSRSGGRARCLAPTGVLDYDVRKDAPVPRSTARSSSTCRSAPPATTTTASCAASKRSGRDPHPRAVPATDAGRGPPSTSTTRASCCRPRGRLHDHRGDHPALQARDGGRQGARRRGVLVHRGRQRRARLLPRVRRQRHAVPRAHPAAVLSVHLQACRSSSRAT
jgi:hypothetical protein